MHSIISSIFSQSGYIKKKTEQGTFFTHKDENKKSFWLIVQNIDLADVIDKQSKLFKECKNICNDSDLDKNISLLVLNESENDFTFLNQAIMSVEEDPYLFRKYVLHFSKHEVTKIVNKLDGQSVPDFLSQQISNEDTFQYYRNNPEELSWEALIYRIVIKLPFINPNISAKVEMSRLWNKKDEKLNFDRHSDLLELDKTLFDDANLDSIATMEATEILDLLMPIQDIE